MLCVNQLLLNTGRNITTERSPIPENGLKIEEIPNPPKVTPIEQLGEVPAWIDCPYCKRRTQTRVQQVGSSSQEYGDPISIVWKHTNSLLSLLSIVCCLICICLVCLPSMAGWLSDFEHYCTNCGNKVAKRSHDGGPVQVFAPQATGDVPTIYKTAMPATPAPAKKS